MQVKHSEKISGTSRQLPFGYNFSISLLKSFLHIYKAKEQAAFSFSSLSYHILYFNTKIQSLSLKQAAHPQGLVLGQKPLLEPTVEVGSCFLQTVLSLSPPSWSGSNNKVHSKHVWLYLDCQEESEICWVGLKLSPLFFTKLKLLVSIYVNTTLGFSKRC